MGLSTEYGLMKLRSGGSRDVVRLPPKDNLVAKGEAVNGKGFRLTVGDEVEEADETVLERIEGDCTRGLMTGSCLLCPSGGSMTGWSDVGRSDESEA